MLKSSYITFLLMCLAHVASAQSPTLTINEAALLSGHVTVDASGYNYNAGILSLFPSIHVNSTSASLSAATGTNTIPVTHFTAAIIRGTKIGAAVTLSTTSQAITGDLLGLLNFGGGSFSVRYTAPSLSSFAWQAGNYSTVLTYGVSSIGIGASVSPTNPTLNVVVPAFITATNEPGDVELLVNNLNYFRNQPLSTVKTISYHHTVPLLFNLNGNQSLFTFSNGNTGVQPPQTNINLVNARITAPVQNPLITLSNLSQTFYSASTVPIGNTTNNTAQFSISPASLLAGFINKGTYTNTLNMEVKDKTSTYSGVTLNKSLTLRVIVSDLSELTINTSTIALKFITAENYRNGVTVDANNHLVLSKTTPYDVTVKSDNANFTLGATNTIPVSVLSIGPANGQIGVNTISDLSIQPQILVNAASPVVDRSINIRYSIPASKTQNLLNKQAGTYTTNVIYTLTAH